jgi:hypothetical protein
MNIQTAIKLVAWLIAGFACQLLSHAEPAELTAARLAYETKLAVSKGKLDTALSARGKQYTSVIKVLEDRASAEGKLDAVVLLKAEREAFEQGKWTTGFGANLAKVPPEARDARRLVDFDFARLRAAAAPDGRRLAGEYIKALEAIERKLTTQQDVAGAVEVRKARTAIQEDGTDPLNYSITEVVGKWRFDDPKVNSPRHGRTVTFMRNGTWRDSKESTGKWMWKNRQNNQIELKWDAENWYDHYELSTDGMTLKGTSSHLLKVALARLP